MSHKIALPHLFELPRRPSLHLPFRRSHDGSAYETELTESPSTESPPLSSGSSTRPSRGQAMLEPWIAPLREAGWQEGDLSAFLPEGAGSWRAEYSALVDGLRRWNLPTDPYAGAHAHGLSKESLAFIKANVPPELRHTAYSFSGSMQVLQQRVTLSPEFIDALAKAERRAARKIHHGKSVSLPYLPEGPFLWMAEQLPGELYSIYATEISQADLERVITAVFVLQCRARFAATARAMIESRTHDRVYRAFSGVLHLSRGPREVPAGTAKHTQSLPLPQAIAMAQA